VNVLVGFAPSNESVGGKLLLTGNATLDLRNPFGNGETFGVNWQQLQSQSPRLNLLLQRPFVFNSPFGLNFSFELYKKDSSYININALAGVQYVLSAHQSGSVYLQTTSTRVLNIDTSLVILTRQLPPDIDAGAVSLALQYEFNNTDYRFNPRRGNELQFTTSFGNKHIKKSSAILQIKNPSFNYASLYDTLKLNSYQVKFRIAAAHYFPVGRQSTVKTAANAGWYQSPSYFQNELFQIGGYRLLRGFDEESIYTNRFAVCTAEYHYLLGQNSYLFAFTDAGWARYQTILTSFSHTYIGIGFGLAFETKTGVFNISFAEGKRDDGSFDFRQSKIHLGFVSVF
ncbi:MAG TPA: BamA/TamA family outer membrane protein, partial [Chitinophagaceae bacterium]|nr:BamA/TamA family outer membrane protein [Chitinophagaceae bacterium]